MNNKLEHLQKMILFSEENYAGDALVLMRNKIPDNNIPAYKEIDLNHIKYAPREGAELVSFSGIANSLIVDTGDWMVRSDGSPVHMFTATSQFFTKLSDKEGFYPINWVYVSRSYDKPSPVVVEKSDPQLLQNLYSPEKKHYKLTFFPLENAFAISPAPACVRDDDTRNFRWEFRDGDEFSVNFYAEGKTVTESKLIFKTHETNSERNTPIAQWVNGKWTTPESDVVDVHAGDRFKYILVHNGAKWGFDFTCKIDDQYHLVDPEVQVGAGTGR